MHSNRIPLETFLVPGPEFGWSSEARKNFYSLQDCCSCFCITMWRKEKKKAKVSPHIFTCVFCVLCCVGADQVWGQLSGQQRQTADENGFPDSNTCDPSFFHKSERSWSFILDWNFAASSRKRKESRISFCRFSLLPRVVCVSDRIDSYTRSVRFCWLLQPHSWVVIRSSERLFPWFNKRIKCSMFHASLCLFLSFSLCMCVWMLQQKWTLFTFPDEEQAELNCESYFTFICSRAS